jgi:hypothetical protein
LPQLIQANQQLEEALKHTNAEEFDIENVESDEENYIDMVSLQHLENKWFRILL